MAGVELSMDSGSNACNVRVRTLRACSVHLAWVPRQQGERVELLHRAPRIPLQVSPKWRKTKNNGVECDVMSNVNKKETQNARMFGI